MIPRHPLGNLYQPVSDADALEVRLPDAARHPIGVALILSDEGVAA